MNFLDFYNKFLRFLQQISQNFLIFSKNVFKFDQINVKSAKKNPLNFKVFSEITLTCLYSLLKFLKI